MIVILTAIVLLAVGFWLSDYGDSFAILLQTIGLLLLLYALPSYINKIISQKLPDFGALVKGESPYEKLSALPKRTLIVAIYAFSLVALGIVIVACLYFSIAHIK